MNTTKIGRQSEKLILKQYLKRGYKLVAQNFEFHSPNIRGHLGEIDLILETQTENQKILVLVEAKFRNKPVIPGVEAITQTKLKKIYQTYQYFLKQREFLKYQNYFCRLDVAILSPEKLEVIPNAYTFDSFLR